MSFIDILQIIVSILLIIAILLQGRGTGLSTVFGGSGEIFRVRRGAEKILFISTIILAIVFLTLGLINFLIR